MDLHSELRKRAEQEDWDYIARMANTFELEMDARGEGTKKLLKELQMVRKIVHAYISNEKGREKFLTPKFLVKMYKTMKKLESKMMEHEHMRGEFLMFLKVLLHKMKQEKLVVYKTLEKTKEFQKHKGFGDAL